MVTEQEVDLSGNLGYRGVIGQTEWQDHAIDNALSTNVRSSCRLEVSEQKKPPWLRAILTEKSKLIPARSGLARGCVCSRTEL